MRTAVAPALSVVLPAYNEAAGIAAYLATTTQTLRRLLPVFELIVVNDGSTDATATVLQDLQTTMPELRIVQHAANRGYGAALRSGFAATRYPYVFFTDADGQFSLEDLVAFLPHVGPATIVIGYRRIRKDPAHRTLNARLWNACVRLFFGLRVRDLNCAFKVFPTELVANNALTTSGAFINAELLIAAARRNFRVIELPVGHYARLHGQPTGAQFGVILRAFRELYAFSRNQRQKE